jgi:hypothetical protein
VEAGTPEMSQSRVIAVVVGGVCLVVLAGLLVGSVRPTPIVEKSQGREEASAPSPLPDLGLAALVGALAGALGTHLLREQAERAREARERNGLLRIVFSELRLNQVLLRVVDALYHARSMPEDHRRNAGWRALRELRIYMEAWEATRVQLSQHLPSAKFAVIASYYSDLMQLKEYVSKRQEPRKPAFGLPDDTPEVVRELRERGQRAEHIIKEYVPDITTKGITVGDLMRREQRRAGLSEEPEW